jgi:aspartyl-tRNA(Asn)/glutamyl-tRNA(Gln) amidotransferase subunit C
MKSPIDIDAVCALACLHLPAEEKAVLAPQMAKIVEWVGRLSEVQLAEAGDEAESPISFPLPFREDEARECFPAETALANAPEKQNGFFKVPKVIEEK